MAYNNTQICGHIQGKPKLIPKKAGGVFVGSFSIKSQANRKYKPIYIPCLCFIDELAVYIAENYQEGDWIQINKSTLTADKSPRSTSSSVALIIWDVDDEKIDPSIRHTGPDGGDDEEYIAY
jgi:hypothetical protein